MLDQDLPICITVISKPTFWTGYSTCGNPGPSPWGQLFLVSLVALLLISIVLVVQHYRRKKIQPALKMAAIVAGIFVALSLVWAAIAIYRYSY